MLKILSNKLGQYHLIDQTINSQKPEVSSELLEAKAKCLTELRFLAIKVQQGKYSRISESFYENKKEIMHAFQNDISKKTLHKLDFAQMTEHPDTVIWLRIVKEVNKDRFNPTSNIQDHMNSTHEQWNIGVYHGEIAYHGIKNYFLNFMDVHDFNYIVMTIVGTLGG